MNWSHVGLFFNFGVSGLAFWHFWLFRFAVSCKFLSRIYVATRKYRASLAATLMSSATPWAP